MMRARKAGLLHRLVNDQKLPSILARMPANDWRQWARERPTWIRGAIEEAFWTFMDQKWRDALNVAAAEPTGWGQGGGGSRPHGIDKKDQSGRAEAKKLATAAIHVTATESRPVDPDSNPRRCKFADVLGCPGQHAPWRCGGAGTIIFWILISFFLFVKIIQDFTRVTYVQTREMYQLIQRWELNSVVLKRIR
jgi:hypothetical protein